jgi:hypothetical protein
MQARVRCRTERSQRVGAGVTFVFTLAALLSHSACAPAPKSSASTPAVHASKIEPPEHVALQMACTPTGPELCFNAVDDNCNGVIDEGCGVGTGVLQFTIAWKEEAADVNLSVTDPSGATVDAKTRSRGSLRLDRDCPGAAESCGGQNTENVFFEGLDPPRGHYRVDLALADLHGASAPIVVHFSARIGSQTHSADVPLAPGEGSEKKTFGYDL